MEYFSVYKEESTLRQAEPIGLFYYGQSWHFIGWCRLRKDYRDFRLDRICKLQLLDERFDDTPHPSLSEYIDQLAHEREMQEAFIVFDKEMARYMQSQKYFYGFVSQEPCGEKVRMRFLSAHMDSLARWLLMYTHSAYIESPASLKEMMYKLVEELKAKYHR